MVASWTGPGSVSVLFYADRLFYAPITLGTFGVSVVLLSGWSRMYYQTKDIKKMFSTFRKTTVFLGIISLALTVVLCGFSDQITRVIYGSGMMEKSRLDNISSCFFYYTLGLLPSILAVIIVQIYQVIKKTKVLMYWAMLSVFLIFCWISS
jgi:peptidoglycan biosynthesis protein MviN/MurJ (putative lipid II flippase)